MLEIQHPNKNSEFDIQASLFAVLRFKHKIDVRGEVVDRQLNSMYNKKGYRVCRFDLVVFDKYKKGRFIIECKNDGKIIRKDTRQFKKYSNFNAEIIFCNSMYEVENIAKYIADNI